jgi:ribosomal-protein-alanine acetyltransferase
MPEESLPHPRGGGAGIVIREARPGDIEELARLEESAFATDRLSRRRLKALAASATAALLLARSGGRLLGYALVLTRRGSRAARLYSLAVDPQSTGRGVGSRLLAAAESAARTRGATSLRLEVRVDNAAAIRLYEGKGYRPIGRRESYYQDGAAALRYARTLPRTRRTPAVAPVRAGRTAGFRL